MPPSHPPAPLVAPRARGRYERGAELAAGGMGCIYVAYDRLGQREVAYKRLSVAQPAQRALRVALFRREYDTLAQLPHPNIVAIYDYGEESDGTPYYVMELLGGSDLSRLSPLPYREACRVLRDVASALALVHARRLIHRDVSPSNVRLTADGRAKLLDFGALTRIGRVTERIGTPAFTAPEALTELELDPRSDLYSLGALAYWALTRRVPFTVRSLEESAAAFVDPPAPPSAYVKEIPRALDELVLSLLALDPRARPAHAAYVLDRLTSIAELGPEPDEGRVAQSYLARPPLCGRTEAIATVQDVVAHLRGGRGRSLLVEGESGVGKTALLDAAATHAQLQGCVVLRAQATSKVEPFRLVRALVDGAFALYPELEGSLGPASTRSAMFDHLQERWDRAPDVAEIAARHAMTIESALACLLEVSRRTPLVVVVDDIHQGDAESMAFLTALAAQSTGAALAIVLGALAGRLSSSTASGAKLAASATRLPISSLTREDVGELIQRIFGAVPNSLGMAHWLFRESGGNVSTVLDLARSMLQHGAIRYTLGTFTLPIQPEIALPGEARDVAALARVSALRVDSERVAIMLSLHPGPLTPEQIATATSRSVRDTVLSLEELVQRGVVAKEGEEFEIAGERLRAALQGRGDEALRETLHLALARTLLEQSRVSPNLLYDASFHFLRAGREDEAVELVVGIPHRTLYQQDATRRLPLLEALLAVASRQRRSKQQCLSLMLPLAAGGFFGSYQTQARHIGTALAWMSELCGMTLAGRLRRFLGGKLALLVGLLYAAVRLALTPKRERLGSLRYLISYFVGLVCDSTASSAALGDMRPCLRDLAWLEPLSALPPTSAGWLLREFCLATTEVGRGRMLEGAERYGRLLSALARPVKGLEASHKSVYLGAVNGRGLAEAVLGRDVALQLAEELRSDAFFAAHAESISVSYYLVRGDVDRAELHRQRAELLALRGRASWTAASAHTLIAGYTAAITEDAIALVRVISELALLSTVAPVLAIRKRICEAWLEHIRGRSESARALFEQVVTHEDVPYLSTWLITWSQYARVLNDLGEHQRAHEACSGVMAPPLQIGFSNLRREHAVALAALGRTAEALACIDEALVSIASVDSPLELGGWHRDRARIALITGDRAAFDEHFSRMETYFLNTRNPCLLRQCEALRAKAEQRGMRAVALHASLPHAGPSWSEDDATVDSLELRLRPESTDPPPPVDAPRQGSATRHRR